MKMREFPNFTTVNYSELDIDWTRVAEPQEDNYDVDSINKVAGLLFGYKKPTWPKSKPRVFDRKVALHHTSSHYGGAVIIVPEGDERLDRIKNFNAFFKKVSPKYYKSIYNTLDLYVPMYDENSGESAGIGCTCGPVTKAYETGPDISFPCIGVTSTINTEVGAIDGIIHETFHQRLYQLGIEMEDSNMQLITNDPNATYNSPIRFDITRPMTACVQAIYSYVCVTEYYADVVRYGLGSDPGLIDKYGLSSFLSTCAYNVHRISNGRILMHRHLETDTQAGKQFFGAFYDFMDRVIDSTVEVMAPYQKQYNLNWEPTFK
jgi:hypothetical protein